MKKALAFTLVELLVVVAIIVVLLALLVPALDKAISAAEMATCMANLKGIATGASAYAVGNKRYYPAPALVSAVPWAAWIGSTDGAYPGDRRKAWKEAVGSINDSFQCPLLDAGINMETTQSDQISANYELFAGWGFVGNPLLRRVGDRLVYNDPTSARPGLRSYDVLASDRNLIQKPTDAQSSHPDRDGKLSLLHRQDGGDPWFNDVAVSPYRTTTSLWWSYARGSERGLVDSNFAATDTSVQRINDIAWDHDESEMGRVPVYYQADNGVWPSGWSYVPLN